MPIRKNRNIGEKSRFYKRMSNFCTKIRLAKKSNRGHMTKKTFSFTCYQNSIKSQIKIENSDIFNTIISNNGYYRLILSLFDI